MRTKLLTLLLCLLTTLPALASTFEVDNICYTITGDNTVEVTCNYYDRFYSGSITIPAEVQYDGKTYSVTSIGNYAFSDYVYLTSVTIPNSITKIGEDAFRNCTYLTEMIIPNSVTSIGGNAFNGCYILSSVTIPNSVTYIGYQAFIYTGVTSVTIPNSVSHIGDGAFAFCRSLKEIYCEAVVPPTCGYGSEPFYNTYDEYDSANYTFYTLYVPAVAVEAYRNAEGWKYFVNIVGVDNNEVEEPEEPTWQTAVTIEEEAKQWLFVPYVWASSDEAVASVSQTGEVTAVAPGTCTVTFTCGDLVYSCVVTVSNKSTGVAEVSSVSPAVAYDLQGRRVSNPRRGIFIVNGQKQRLN